MTVRDVEFIFLGTGTSSGVPVIGCSCPTCTSTDPRDHRLRCGAAIRFTDPAGQPRTILIDVPPDHREQSLRHGLNRCDGLFVTHAHVDHVYGLDEVRRYNALMRAPIGVHAEPEVTEALHRIFQHIYARQNNRNDSFVADLFDVALEPLRPVFLHGLRFTPVRLLHGRLPILGFRIDAVDSAGMPLEDQPDPLPLAWCTDVSSVPPESWEPLRGLRTLVLDMLRDRAHPTHMTFDESVSVAETLDSARTFFIHMSHDSTHQELLERMPPGMAPAWDGLILGLATNSDL